MMFALEKVEKVVLFCLYVFVNNFKSKNNSHLVKLDRMFIVIALISEQILTVSLDEHSKDVPFSEFSCAI